MSVRHFAYRHKSHTLAPSRKHETMPSSLILRTGPKRLATRAAVVRAPSARAGGDARSQPERECASWRRIAPKASSRPLESVDEGAVETGQGLEHGGVELGHRTTPRQVMNRAFGQGLDESGDRDVSWGQQGQPRRGKSRAGSSGRRAKTAAPEIPDRSHL